LTDRSIIGHADVVPRPREFERDVVLDRAMHVFWQHGYASTSTESLLAAMGIQRQSLYNTFGDKRKLYLEALQAYQDASVAAHLHRLEEPSSALAGLRQLLVGIAAPDDDARALGCMGVCAAAEFGATDPEVTQIRRRSGRPLRDGVLARIREGQVRGEVAQHLDAHAATDFVLMTMTGLQVAARDGATVDAMRQQADFAMDRLSA
jgi:TetR/AcrR family transcriptional regulator, transcriptional repressor for nem operon